MPPHATLLEQHRRRTARAIDNAHRQGETTFLAWFNREGAHTPQQRLVRAEWDFSFHILTPRVCAALSQPEQRVALEIGSGGGRLLLPASRHFRHVIGLDIHAHQRSVAAFLQRHGATNITLLTTRGDTIGVADGSIDFIYSFIVLQHLPSWGVFACYIAETARCLAPGGVAQLYYGSFARLHPLLQVCHAAAGYREVRHAPANHVSLVVRDSLVRRLCRRAGLRVVMGGSSFYCAPDGYPLRRGGQRFVTLVKPR